MLYAFPLFLATDGTVVNKKSDLDVREGIEHLPPTWDFHGQKFNNVAWGADRVRLTTLMIDSPKNRHRGGFYLHDSTKGFSHGCIEVDPIFFAQLRAFVKESQKQKSECF